MHRFHRHHRSFDEHGFSLVELLTVVVILGTLASIAIVSYVGQRQRAWAAAAKSDLHVMQTAQFSLLTSFGDYSADLDVLVQEGFRETEPTKYEHGVCVFESGGHDQFLVAARHTASPSTWVWDTVVGDYTEVSETDLVAVMLSEGAGCEEGFQTR